MKYYEIHKEAYKVLAQNGAVAWDGETDRDKIFDHEIIVSLEKRLSHYFKDPTEKSAIDLGTGMGTCALYLSKYGFKARGHDISETAISKALENAAYFKLDTDFFCGDILSLECSEKFDLITDSSFLHCLVTDEDRKKFFDLAKNIINDHGKLFIHTMVHSDDMSNFLTAPHILLKEDILWSTGNEDWDMDWTEIDGRKVFSHRRIKKVRDLEQEFADHGFEVVEKSVIDDPGNPDSYVAWLALKNAT
ncbi:MAG: class I SAM-dependent methyltransferase [Bacteriovoracaceae bacterium]|jgi:SAM-dependent methyltransferase|nr:class I SAM-dependent methyltransferase [Bacteriovoracaceae bacterium]